MLTGHLLIGNILFLPIEEDHGYIPYLKEHG